MRTGELFKMSAVKKNDSLFTDDAIEALVKLINDPNASLEAKNYAIKTLTNLALNKEIVDQIVETSGDTLIGALVNLIDSNANHETKEYAARVLFRMSIHEKNDSLFTEDGIAALVKPHQ